MILIKKAWYYFSYHITRSKLSKLNLILLSIVMRFKIIGWLFDTIDKITNSKNINNTKKYFDNNEDRIKSIIDLFSDEQSKEVYQNVILYRGSKKRNYVNTVMSKPRYQYFDSDIIPAQNGEYFLDCGACYGESSIDYQKFLKNQGCESPEVLAVEPDATNYEKMVKQLEKIDNTVYPFHCGVWSEKGQIQFMDKLNRSSRVSEDGKVQVAVNSIDNLVKEVSFTPTYIKMDVEGSEPEALRGAEETITRFHPKLAISIYHSDAQFLEIVEYIHEKYPDYKLYIRHYSCLFAETVLYAI